MNGLGALAFEVVLAAAASESLSFFKSLPRWVAFAASTGAALAEAGAGVLEETALIAIYTSDTLRYESPAAVRELRRGLA
jgi:hypothetical protein